MYAASCRMLWWLGAPGGLLLAVGALWGPIAVALGIGQVLHCYSSAPLP
jgi:hypothetical protein